jgi:zinc protease
LTPAVRDAPPRNITKAARDPLPMIPLFRRTARTLGGLVVAAIALAGTAQAAPKPDVAHFTLDNGLEVVVVPDRRAPVVSHMIWYKVCAADETPGNSGLAHFLEHLMF